MFKTFWCFQFSQKTNENNSTWGTIISSKVNFFLRFWVENKVHIFWEVHKILRNLHCRFDWHYIGQIGIRWRFRKIVWPSQNIWTLKPVHNKMFSYEVANFKAWTIFKISIVIISAAPKEFTKPPSSTKKPTTTETPTKDKQDQNNSNNVAPKTAWWMCTFILILQKIWNCRCWF